MKISRFEDIEAWREARELAKQTYTLTDSDPFRKDFGLAGQIQKAAVSTMSNIAEGFDSGSRVEFLRFLGYSRRSASEVQSHLYVAVDRNYIAQDQFEIAYEQAEKVRRFITAFMKYLKTLRPVAVHQRANALTR